MLPARIRELGTYICVWFFLQLGPESEDLANRGSIGSEDYPEDDDPTIYGEAGKSLPFVHIEPTRRKLTIY